MVHLGALQNIIDQKMLWQSQSVRQKVKDKSYRTFMKMFSTTIQTTTIKIIKSQKYQSNMSKRSLTSQKKKKLKLLPKDDHERNQLIKK